MHYLMKVGPMALEREGPATAYLALGDQGGVDAVFADSDVSGLKQLVAKHGQELVCEPALKAAARSVGLPVEPPPPSALALKVGFAIVFAHGPTLKLHNLELVVELAQAFAAFMHAEPWAVFEVDEALSIELDKPNRSYEACVMGQGGEVFGLALYSEVGSVQRIQELSEAGSPPGALAFPCTSVFAEEEPAYVAEAMNDFAGLAAGPSLICLRRGAPAPLTEGDVAAVVASLKAVAALAAQEEGVGTAEAVKRPVTARATRPGVASGPGQGWHERDHRLVEALVKFSKRRFSDADMKRMGAETFGAREPQLGLIEPLVAYEWPVEAGQSLAAHFLKEPAAPLDEADRQWLEAEVASRLGPWEVLRVEPGEGLELVNLLTGARRFVREKKGTQGLVPRDVILARVVDVPEMSVLGGTHLRPLPPGAADEVVRQAKAEAPAPGWKTTVRLLELWDEAVSRQALKLASPMRVRNTDGHDAAQLEDEYALKKGDLASVLSRLATLEGAELSGQDARGAHLVFTRPGNPHFPSWKNTIVGSARLKKTKLVLATNSRERADALRASVTAALEGLATHRRRTEHPLPTVRGGQELMIDAQSVASPSMAEVQRGWLDTEVPALGGRTPRDAASDAALVPELHLLLKELENLAARGPGGRTSEAEQFRRELGLDELGARVGDERRELERAIGYGRKISETLLDFANLVLDEEAASGPKALEPRLRFATAVWNIVVAQERGWEPKSIEELRAKLGPRAFPVELLKSYDALVERKRTRFSGDLRMVGTLQLKRLKGVTGVEMQALLPPELIDRARAAGIRP